MHTLEILEETYRNAAKFYPAMAPQLYYDYQQMLQYLLHLMNYNFENNAKLVHYRKWALQKFSKIYICFCAYRFFIENQKFFGRIHRLAVNIINEMVTITSFRGWSPTELNDLKFFLQKISIYLGNDDDGGGGAGGDAGNNAATICLDNNFLSSIFKLNDYAPSSRNVWSSPQLQVKLSDIFDCTAEEERSSLIKCKSTKTTTSVASTQTLPPPPDDPKPAIFYNTNISFNWFDDIEREDNE